MNELKSSDIVRKQHTGALNRRAKRLSGIQQHSDIHESIFENTHSYDLELAPLSFDHRTVTVGKRLSETGADENTFFGNATNEDTACHLLAGHQLGGLPWLSSWPKRTEPKDFDSEVYRSLNQERYKKSLPRHPSVRFGVVNGGPFYHFGIGLSFRENSFDPNAGIVEGRDTFQASSILKVEPKSPYQFRGFNFVQEIGAPVFYVKPESTIKNRQNQLLPFQLRTSTDGVVENRNYTLSPSLGRFAEKLLHGGG